MKNQTVELTRRIHDPREIYFQLKEIRKNLCQHAGIYLKEFQERASDEIFWKYSLGGNQEVVMLWARRSGKTECLVITGLCICLFEIHVNRPVMQGISKQFLWGLVNPSRTEQGVMVTRQRIKDRVESIEKWLLTDWGIHSELGDGRKTPDFVLRSDALNSEAQIRAISGHPTASEKGAGFQLMFIEQVENLDEQTMKTVIFPMAAGSELTLTKVLAGTPDLVIENEYFHEKSLTLKYPFLIDWKAAGAEREDYRRFVTGELSNLGESSEAFLTQYACVWVELRNRLIDADALRILQNDYVPQPKKLRGAGIDVAKTVDSTVVTVGERNGFDTQILGWLELHGVNYETQADEVTRFLDAWNVKLSVVDATGVGKPFIDMLRKRWKHQVIAFNSTSQNNSDNWELYKRELDGGRVHYPKAFPVDTDEGRKQNVFLARFIEQHRDAIRDVTDKGMIQVHASERADYHDDYVTSAAFCINACIRPDPAGLFTSAAARREQ